MANVDPPAEAAPTGRPLAWATALVVAFLALTGWPMVRPGLDVFDAVDEQLFHHPAIQGFVREFPRMDLVDYPSATTPLYHLVMASLGGPLHLDLAGLRVLNLAFSVAALLLAWGWLVRLGGVRRGTALVLPLMASPYFVGAAVRLSTDNFALLMVFASLAVLDAGAGPPDRRLVGAGILGGLAALTRQVHAWTAGLVAVEAIRTRRWKALAAALVPVLVLVPFVVLWGGLAPPAFSMHEAAPDPVVPIYVLALLGGFGIFFCPWLVDAWRRHGGRAWLAGAAVAGGLGVVALFPIHWQPDPRRFGGALWSVAGRLPEVHGTSVAFWGLVPLGVLVGVALVLRARTTERWVPVVALGLWLVANVVSARVYQKYYEPFLLVVLAAVVAGWRDGERRWWWLGPLALAGGLAAVDVGRFFL